MMINRPARKTICVKMARFAPLVYGCMIILIMFLSIFGTGLVPEVQAQSIVRVQGNANGGWSTGTSFTVTQASAPTAGNLNILTYGSRLDSTNTVSIISISQTGVTWTPQAANAHYYASLTMRTEIWAGVVGSGTSATITITLSASPSGATANVCEYSGLSTSGFLDVTANNGGNSESTQYPTTGTTSTTNQAVELWVGSISQSDQTQSDPTNGFTMMGGTVFNAYLEKIVSSTGTASAGTTLPGNNRWAGAIATFTTTPVSSIVRVQGNARGSGSTPFTVTQASAPTAGNLNILTYGGRRDDASANVITSISQTGVTWTLQAAYSFSASSVTMRTEIWAGVVGSGASATITITLSAGSGMANVCEYSGLSTSGFLDVTATSGAHSEITSWTSTGTTSTTSQAVELWVGSISASDSGSQSYPTNGFTMMDGTWCNAYLEKIVSSTGTASAGTIVWLNNRWAGAIATFKAVPKFNLNLKVVTFDGTTILSGAQVTVNNGTDQVKIVTSGWANYTGVSVASVTIKVSWQNSWVNGTFTQTMGADRTVTVVTKVYSSYALSWRFNDNSTAFTPTQIQLLAPNSTLVTLSGSSVSSLSLVQNGTWTVQQVSKWGNNVVAATNPTFTPTGNSQTRQMACRVYSATPVWKDNAGASLYAAISSYKITYPNSTLSGTLSSGTAYWIQNGTSTISAVTWKGTDVTPTSATFSAESGSPTFNLKIYALHIKNQDNLAISLAQNVQLTFPNATAITFTPITGWIDLLQVQTGTVTITTPITVSGTERYVLTDSSTISLTSDTTVTKNWRHDLKNVVLAAKDGTGTTILSPALSSFTVQLSNGTSIANPTSATWMATGTTTLTAATWEGSNVCNSATVSITAQVTYYFNVNVYSRSLTFRYDDGATTFVPTQVQFTAPNGTLITLTSYTAVLLQNGTSTITSITYWGNNVVPATHPTFDVSAGNAWIDARVYATTPIWKDSSGAALYSSPSSFKWTAPNATLSGALASGTAYWIQNGTSTISEVTWKGSNVTPSSGMTFDASTGSPTKNLRIYAFTMQGKDQSGYNIPSSFAITFPNATTTTFVGNSTGYYSLSQVQNGSYTLNMIWNALTVNGSLAQSVTADKTLSFVGLVYYTATNSYRAAVSDGTLSNVVATDQAISFDATAIGLKTIKVHVPTKSLPQGVYIDGVLTTLNADYTYDDATKLVSIPYGFSTHTFMITWQSVVSGPSGPGGGGGALTTTPTTPLEQIQKILEIAKGNPYIVGIIGMVGLFGGAGVAYQQDRKRISVFLLGMGAFFTFNALFFWNILPQQVLQTNLGGILPLTIDKYLLPIPSLELPTTMPTGQEITTWIMTLILLAAPISVLAYVAIRE